VNGAKVRVNGAKDEFGNHKQKEKVNRAKSESEWSRK
jgi:hypothetical protein